MLSWFYTPFMWLALGVWIPPTSSFLSVGKAFILDQLYNPHAGEFCRWEFYRVHVQSVFRVFRRVDGFDDTRIRSFPVFSFLAASHRLPYWHSLVYTTPAFDRIPMIGFAHEMHLNAADWRIRIFKIIRARVCRQWLARVRLEVCGCEWCDEVVASVIIAQLEAWFATVAHEDVQWSEYDDLQRRYRVIQW